MKIVLFGNRYLRDRKEETLSTLVHTFALGLACAGALALYYKGSLISLTHMYAGIVYGIAHVMVYAASVAYHYTESPPIKSRLRILDQTAIYAAIAGTYTPVLAIGISDPWSYGLVCLLWTACACGIIYKIKNSDQPEKGSILTYVAFAGAGSALFFLCRSGPIDESRTAFLVSGALDVVGLIFYSWHYKRFFHTIWHVFVVLGHMTHFYAVWTYFMH